MNTITIDGVEYNLVPVTKNTEETKQPLTYPNGALVYTPDHGRITFYIHGDCVLCDRYDEDSDYDKWKLVNQNIFLTEELAQRALDYHQTHSRLLKRIMEINAENNWVADWKDKFQPKYYINLSMEYGFRIEINYMSKNSSIYMCDAAGNWLMSGEVSDDERKKFLFIYD